MKKHFKTYFYIVLGVVLIAIAYYFLFLPQDIVIGGVTGIAIIINGIIGERIFSSALLILILNGILLLFGLLFLGKEFVIKTLLGSILLPFIVWLFEVLKIPSDILFRLDQEVLKISSMNMNPVSQLILSVLLGSILTGIGLGLCFKNGATTGGMDIVQKIMVKVFHFPYSKTIYITDGIIVLLVLFVFGIEKTMYSLMAIFIAGIIIDMVYMGTYGRRSVFIISTKQAQIKEVILTKLKRGVTVIPVKGGFSDSNFEMLVCTLSKSESYLLKDLISEIDPKAFTFYVSVKEVYGDGFR